MTDKQFQTVFLDALSVPDRDAFVSDWALSSAWGDDPDAEIPGDRLDQLGEIWDVEHLSIRDIRAKTGLSQAAFAVRYCIPVRSVENWESGSRACPEYLRLLLAQSVGYLKGIK